MWRRIAGLALTLLLIVSLVGTVRSGLAIYRAPAFKPLVDEAQDRIEAKVECLAAREITQEKLDRKLKSLLLEEPRNWLAIDAVIEVAGHHGVAPSPKLANRIADAREHDNSLLRKAGRCLACSVNADSCDFSWILACRAPVDLTPIGDVVGVSRQLINMALGQEVDQFDLTLSVIGLGAEAMTLTSAGSSYTVKIGASLLKTARKMGAISRPLARAILRAGKRAIDWKLLKNSPLSALPRNLKRAIRPKALRPLREFMGNVLSMQDDIGTVSTFYLLRKVENFTEAHKLARFTRAVKKRAVGYMELLGKSRILRATLRYADEAIAFVAWIGGFVVGIVIFFKNLILSFLNRRFRRFLRRSVSKRKARA